MPWRSKQQARWGHSVGMKELGAAKVKEYDQATVATKKGFAGLPRKVKKSKK